jgi:hypothetical protein
MKVRITADLNFPDDHFTPEQAATFAEAIKSAVHSVNYGLTPEMTGQAFMEAVGIKKSKKGKKKKSLIISTADAAKIIQ